MDLTSATKASSARAVLARLRSAASVALRRHSLTFGVPLVAGSALRLIWLGDTSFLGDQAELLALSRSAFDHHALIATGIYSSINTLNPPVSAWLYAPFALLGGPLAAALFTALANIAAIGLLYALTTRYGGRCAGFVAALLYATASGAVHYSRFIWQQNLMAPFLLLLLGALLAGLVERRVGWLGWAALFWGVCFQLHPTAGALLAPFALAVVLARGAIRRRDLGWAALALAALFGPLLLWELASHGQDLAQYVSLGTRHPVTDTIALSLYGAIIAPAAPVAYGASSSYVATGRALVWLGGILQALAAVSVVWLASALYHWRSGRVTWSSLRSQLRSLSATPRWRLAATLLMWQALPILLLIRHTAKVQEHYLLVLLPVIYLTIGLWAATASRWLQARVRPAHARWLPIALVGITLALALAQTVGVATELATIHGGAYDGVAIATHYGIPLSSEQATLAAAERLAARENATLAIASTRVQQEPYGYLTQTGEAPAATVYISDGCLIVPAAGSAHSLVTLALPDTLAARALPTLTGARADVTLHAQGSAPLTLYQLAPGAAPKGEITLATATSATTPRLAGYSLTQDSSGARALILRWSGAPPFSQPARQRATYWFGAASSGPVVVSYTIAAQPLDAHGRPAGAPVTATCGRLAWPPDMDVLAWLPLKDSASGVAAWRVTMSAGPLVALRPTFGPLPLETGAVNFAPPRPLTGPMDISTP